MKKIFTVVSFVILMVTSVSAQVNFDTFISKIYYGMTEYDLVREFGDEMQYYAPGDTTNNRHDLAMSQHKLNLIENFHIVPSVFSDYEINLQIENHVIPVTISLDSLSRTVKTFVFALDLIDSALKKSDWDTVFRSVLGTPDEFNNYYYSNCLLNTSVENYFSPFVATIALTDHKMTTDEFKKYGIQQVHMQDEFLGIPLLSTYRAAKKIMSNKGNINYSLRKNELLYENISFGGLYWNCCILSFNEKKEFTNIAFVQCLSSETTILEKYQDLKTRLQKKYSMDNGFLPMMKDLDWQSDKTMGITFGSKHSTVLCRLSVAYMPSQEFDEPYYYLFLSYYDSRFVKNHDDDL